MIVNHSNIGKKNIKRRRFTTVAIKPYLAKVRVKSYLYKAIEGKRKATKEKKKSIEAQIP